MRCFVEGDYNFTRPPRDDAERARGPCVVGCSACDAEFHFDELIDGGIPPHDVIEVKGLALTNRPMMTNGAAFMPDVVERDNFIGALAQRLARMNIRNNASKLLVAHGMNGVPIYKDPNLPLDRPVLDGDGREIGREPALCWKIEGAIFVHPDRWQTFIDCIVQAGGKIITTKPGDPS